MTDLKGTEDGLIDALQLKIYKASIAFLCSRFIPSRLFSQILKQLCKKNVNWISNTITLHRLQIKTYYSLLCIITHDEIFCNVLIFAKMMMAGRGVLVWLPQKQYFHRNPSFIIGAKFLRVGITSWNLGMGIGQSENGIYLEMGRT